MKEKKRLLQPNFADLFPLLITAWRRAKQIAGGGPLDRLHTREFQSVAEEMKKREPTFSTSLLYHFPVHYAEGLSLLSELPEPPKRVLNISCGFGAFALAASTHGAEEVVGIDSNVDSLRIGASIIGKLGFTFTQREWNYPERLPVTGKFDLIILGYTLMQEDFIDKLLDYLTDTGVLLLVDDSWKEANNRLMKLRDSFVAKGLHILAPCIFKGTCPALKGGFPCFAQRPFKNPFLVAELQKAAGINLSSLKMSYLMVSRQPRRLIAEEPLYRVVSPSIDTRVGKRFFLCGTDGYKALGSRLKEHPKESRAFEYLNRGDIISIENALVSKDTLEIIEDTQVTITAAVGKPVYS